VNLDDADQIGRHVDTSGMIISAGFERTAGDLVVERSKRIRSWMACWSTMIMPSGFRQRGKIVAPGRMCRGRVAARASAVFGMSAAGDVGDERGEAEASVRPIGRGFAGPACTQVGTGTIRFRVPHLCEEGHPPSELMGIPPTTGVRFLKSSMERRTRGGVVHPLRRRGGQPSGGLVVGGVARERLAEAAVGTSAGVRSFLGTGPAGLTALAIEDVGARQRTSIWWGTLTSTWVGSISRRGRQLCSAASISPR
jgi:hypothetical protein